VQRQSCRDSRRGKDFCAGADLAQLQRVAQGDVLDNLDDALGFADLLLQMRRLKKPIIAAVHGRAFAGGVGIATACDLVLATRSAQFCYTEVKSVSCLLWCWRLRGAI
jgi:methylglutaconyl-CoA hydratase